MVGVAACVAGAFSWGAATPAAAASDFTSAVALNPDDTLGLDVGAGGVDVDSSPAEWNVIDQGSGTWDGVSGESYEFQVPGSTFCLVDTTRAGSAVLGRCGANGTSWVNTDTTGRGEFLYERYGLNHAATRSSSPCRARRTAPRSP